MSSTRPRDRQRHRRRHRSRPRASVISSCPNACRARTRRTSSVATPLGPITPSGLLITTDGLWTHGELVIHPLVADQRRDRGRHGDLRRGHRLRRPEPGPWTAFRGISDRTYDGFVDDRVMALTRADGTTDGKAVARLLATRPWIIPTLARLARGTERGQPGGRVAAVAACRAWPNS